MSPLGIYEEEWSRQHAAQRIVFEDQVMLGDRAYVKHEHRDEAVGQASVDHDDQLLS